MNVQVRLKRAESRRGWPRRAEYAAPRMSAPEPASPKPQPRRRHGGPSQDRALYTCSCGFVFEALVSTSVGCPHCGDTQAW
jgi:hypothetical protein